MTANEFLIQNYENRIGTLNSLDRLIKANTLDEITAAATDFYKFKAKAAARPSSLDIETVSDAVTDRACAVFIELDKYKNSQL